MTLVLVYDGGCPFCRQFALGTELMGARPGLELRDGRADHDLRAALKARGLNLARGAVLLEGEQAWHGAEAISELCRRLEPSTSLLKLLGGLFSTPSRARRIYPLLLLARRMALQWKGLPEDPDRMTTGRSISHQSRGGQSCTDSEELHSA
jgi:predicted DCC family thiol-disulfide oxidoreductase YuxK